jgi:hypothetical protein
MPVFIIDESNGQFMGEHSQPYPCPPMVMESLTAGYNGRPLKLLDVPPFTGDWWYLPPGQEFPVLRPKSKYTASKTTVVADGVDASILTGIPVGAEMYISGPYSGKMTVEDEEALHINFIQPGQYEIRFGLYPFVFDTLYITATQPGSK